MQPLTAQNIALSDSRYYSNLVPNNFKITSTTKHSARVNVYFLCWLQWRWQAIFLTFRLCSQWCCTESIVTYIKWDNCQLCSQFALITRLNVPHNDSIVVSQIIHDMADTLSCFLLISTSLRNLPSSPSLPPSAISLAHFHNLLHSSSNGLSPQ